MSMFCACFFGRSWKPMALAAVLLAAAPAVGQTADPLAPAWLIRVFGPSNGVAWCAVAAKKEQSQNLSLPNDSVVCLLRTSDRNSVTYAARERTNQSVDSVPPKGVVADEIIKPLLAELDNSQYGNIYSDYLSNQDELLKKFANNNFTIQSPIIEIKSAAKLENNDQKASFLYLAKEIAEGTGKFLINQKNALIKADMDRSAKQYAEQKLNEEKIKKLRNGVVTLAQSLKTNYNMLEIVSIDNNKLNDNMHLMDVTTLQLSAISDCILDVKKCKKNDNSIYIYIAAALMLLVAIAAIGFFVKNFGLRRGGASGKHIEWGGASPRTQPIADKQVIAPAMVRSDDAKKIRDAQLVSDYAQKICETYYNYNLSHNNNENIFDRTLEVLGKFHSLRMELDRIVPSSSRNGAAAAFDASASISYIRNKLEQSEEDIAKFRQELESTNKINKSYQEYHASLNTTLEPLLSCISPNMDGINIYNNQFLSKLEKISKEDCFRREIRLTLSAIYMAWSRLDKDISPDVLASFETVFNLDKIKLGIESVRLMLDTMPDDGNIWSDCLSTGFTNDWMNYLLRADALLFYYFEDAEEIPKLIGVTRFTAEAFRLIFEVTGVVLDKVDVGKPPKSEYEVVSFSDEKLLKIRRVRDSQARLRHKLDGKVVDVISYGYRSIDGVYRPSKVAIFNPSALDSARFTAGE